MNYLMQEGTMGNVIKEKVCGKFYRILLASLLILVGICFWQGLFYINGEPSIDKYSPAVLLLGIFVLSFSLMAAARIIKKCSEKRLKVISFILLTAILAELIFFGTQLIYVPPYDLINIHAEAVNMLENGKISYIEYYAGYTNQQPLTIFLFFLFSIAKHLGITDYNAAGIGFNIVMIFLSAWCTHKICSLWSLKAGVISLIVFLIDPMLFIWASHYYTDTICMPFMLGGVLLFLHAEKTESKKKKILFLILSAFLIFIGGQIRMTAVFPLIAICMFLFIKYPVKSFLKRFAFIVIGLFCAMILISSMLNTYGVKDRRYEYPVTHWLKLGLSENGMYTTEDNNTTKAQDSYEKKVNENISTIKERIKERGVLGLKQLYLKKISKSWSSAAVTERLQTTVESYNTLYKYTTGRSSKAFKYWLQIVRCTMLIFVFAGVILALRRKTDVNAWMFITILGGIVFYIFWEVKPKYILCFLPVFYIIQSYSIIGLSGIFKIDSIKILRDDQKEYLFNRRSLQPWIKGISIFAVIFTIVIGTLSYFQYVSERSIQKDLRVKQDTLYRDGRMEEIGYEGVAQSFTAEGDFNTIEISFINPHKLKGQKYTLSILNSEKKTIYEKTFSSDYIEDNKMHTFHLDEIHADQEKMFAAVRPCQEYEEYIGVNTAVFPSYHGYKKSPDYYLDGCFYAGGQAKPANDLMFIVSEQHIDSIFSQRIFLLLWSMVIIIEIAAGVFFYKTIGAREV